MAILVGNRADIVRSATGHAIRFQMGVEVRVPDIPNLIKQCVERGHVVKTAKAEVQEDASKEEPKVVPKAAPKVTKPVAGKAEV